MAVPRDFKAVPEDLPLVLILVGGLGSRLGSITKTTPKPLLPVNQRPFIFNILDRLISQGVNEVVLCSGYKSERVKDLFKNGFYREMKVLHSVEVEPLGTGGAVKNALELWPARKVIVLNGDSFCEFDVPNLLLFHAGKEADVSLSLLHSNEVSRYGGVKLDDEDRVIGFSEKNSEVERGTINAGVYIFETKVFERFRSIQQFSLETEILERSSEYKIFGTVLKSHEFIDIGVPESYAAAQIFFGGNS